MSDSSRLARIILGAWEIRDSRRLQHGLKHAVRLRPAPQAIDAAEAERREALSAIAAQLRNDPGHTDWTAASARVRACLGLLRHLSLNRP